MTELRVMTYNILKGGSRGAPLHELVREVAPDVLLVNETPRMPLRSTTECRKLAERWKLEFVTGGRSAGSNMICVGEHVEVKRAHSQVLKQPRFQPRRGIASAQLKVRGRLIGVVSCHLSLVEERRNEEVKRVIVEATGLRGPVIIGGDLNEGPKAPAWQEIVRAGYHDPGSDKWLTFPSDKPVKRIDALMYAGQARVIHHGDPGVPLGLQAAASDHRAVLGILEV